MANYVYGCLTLNIFFKCQNPQVYLPHGPLKSDLVACLYYKFGKMVSTCCILNVISKTSEIEFV